jgi:hypothetical protein
MGAAVHWNRFGYRFPQIAEIRAAIVPRVAIEDLFPGAGPGNPNAISKPWNRSKVQDYEDRFSA